MLLITWSLSMSSWTMGVPHMSRLLFMNTNFDSYGWWIWFFCLMILRLLIDLDSCDKLTWILWVMKVILVIWWNVTIWCDYETLIAYCEQLHWNDFFAGCNDSVSVGMKGVLVFYLVFLVIVDYLWSTVLFGTYSLFFKFL